MSEPARRLLTYEDLLAADRGYGPVPELIHGEIAWKAAPRFSHSRAHGRVFRQLGGMDPDGLDPDAWWILIEPDVELAPRLVVRPDLAGWRRETLPECPEGRVPVRPDWVCEILSPTHENHDLVDKRAIYGAHGVPHLWFLHPEERRLEAFELRDGRWLLLGAWTDGARVQIAPFEAVEIDVSGLLVPRSAAPST